MSTKTLTKIIVAVVLIATVCLAATTVFGSIGIPGGSGDALGKITTPTTRVLGIVQYICYAAAVILLIILGVKYMTASPDGKAEIKKSAVQYVIGAALVFAAGAILGIISGTASKVTSN